MSRGSDCTNIDGDLYWQGWQLKQMTKFQIIKLVVLSACKIFMDGQDSQLSYLIQEQNKTITSSLQTSSDLYSTTSIHETTLSIKLHRSKLKHKESWKLLSKLDSGDESTELLKSERLKSKSPYTPSFKRGYI